MCKIVCHDHPNLMHSCIKEMCNTKLSHSSKTIHFRKPVSSRVDKGNYQSNLSFVVCCKHQSVMLYWKDSLVQSVQGSLREVYCLYLQSGTFIYPNYLTFSMPRTHQDVLLHLLASQHASLAVLTHNPLRSGRQVTYVTVRHANINKAEIAQTHGSLLTDDRWKHI